MSSVELAVIGGSGLYQMDGLSDIEEISLDTPFGSPSDAFTVGTLHGRRIAFVPRHGRGHTLTPTEVPYKANAHALKQLGVKYCIAVSACGSLHEAYAPGHLVVPDQLYDNTKLRSSSFFGDGFVAHVSVADPFSPELSDALANSVKVASGVPNHQGGCFITIEGPRFSTKGESNLFRQWGMKLIGMTTSPEAYLLAEAEIAFACIAHVTDYDVWHESDEPVTVEMVMRTIGENTTAAKKAIGHLVENMADWEGEMAAHSALKFGLVTDDSLLSAETKEKFSLLTQKYR